MAPYCPADELQVLSLALRCSSWGTPAGSLPPHSWGSSHLGLPAAPHAMLTYSFLSFCTQGPLHVECLLSPYPLGCSYWSLRTCSSSSSSGSPGGTPRSCRMSPPLPLGFLYSASGSDFPTRAGAPKCRTCLFPLLSPLPSLGHTGRYWGTVAEKCR